MKMQKNGFYASWFLSTTWKACGLTNQSICSSINDLVNCCAASARLKKRHRASELFLPHPSTDCHQTARLRHGHQTMSTAIRIGRQMLLIAIENGHQTTSTAIRNGCQAMHMAMTTRLHRERYAMHRKIQFQAIAFLKLDLLNKTSCTFLYFTKTKHDLFRPKKP